MKSFKSYLKEEQLLTEADTSKATNMEMAICVGYNMLWGKDTKGNQDAPAKVAAVLHDETKCKDLLVKEKKIPANSKGKWTA